MSHSVSEKLETALAANDRSEHDKLKAVQDESYAIGLFLDYGVSRLGLVLCEKPGTRRNQSSRPVPTSRSIQSILAEHFDIDEDKLDAEKAAILAALEAANR